MDLLRREFLRLAAGVVAAPAFARRASADDYPTRPVRIIAGFTAGGGVDITARLIGQWLTERLGLSFVVENRAGAGGNIGTEAVVNAAPDGYTLLLATVPNAVNASPRSQPGRPSPFHGRRDQFHQFRIVKGLGRHACARLEHIGIAKAGSYSDRRNACSGRGLDAGAGIFERHRQMGGG